MMFGDIVAVENVDELFNVVY